MKAARRDCRRRGSAAVAGVTDVIRLPAGVAVVGNSVEATQAAKNLPQGHLERRAGRSRD